MLKKIWSILLIFSLLALGGCWSRREIEDLAIVSALGIDAIEVEGITKYKLSVLVLRPRQLGGPQQPAVERSPDWLITETGNTIFDAGRKMGRRAPRTLVLYHNDMIIISEKVAKENLSDVLDFMQRHKDIRLNTLMYTTPGNTENLLSGMPELEQTLSDEIEEIIIKTNPRISESYAVDLNLFTRTLISPGWDAVMPVIKVLVPPEPLGTPRANKETPRSVMLQGLAVFRKDKLVGYLSPVETKGFLYLIGKAQSGIIPVTLKDTGPDKGKKLSFMMDTSSSKFEPVIKDGRLVMQITITAQGNVIEVYDQLAVDDPATIKKLNEEFSKSVQTLAEETLIKVQKKLKADVLGIGRHIQIKYPDYWRQIEKDWYDLYPDLPVVLKVEGKIRRTSDLANPFKIK